MRKTILLVAALGFGAGAAGADPTDLTAGVLIAHYDPAVEWSDPVPGELCTGYLECCAITNCDQQNPMMEGGASRVWYVLAQWWDEPKTWCLSEFGFGQYDPAIFVFGMSGPCTPGANLEISTPGWPGPMQGTAVAATDIPWSGNFVPVYYFTGYAYMSQGQIPFGPDPATGFGGFINCLIPPQPFEAACLPTMGINAPGIECCSEVPPEENPCCYGDEACEVLTLADCTQLGGVWYLEWPSCVPNPCDIQACCVGYECYEVNHQQCEAMGGWFLFAEEDCGRNPCEEPTAACCVCEICTVTTEGECVEIGGAWLPGIPDCDPNPCESSPSDNMSWGRIKAIYR